MSKMNEISRMNLADLDRPDGLSQDQDSPKESVVQAEEKEIVEKKEISKEESPKKSKGRSYRVDAKMTRQILTEYMFCHSYTQPIMILITLVGIAMGAYALIKTPANANMYLLGAILIVFGYPLSYLTKPASLMKRNPAFSQTYRYTFDEWGLHLRIGTQAVDVQWRYVTKIAKYKHVAVIHTGKNNGHLVPYVDLGDQKDTILAFLDEMKAKNGR